jgi:hypothetical protein
MSYNSRSQLVRWWKMVSCAETVQKICGHCQRLGVLRWPDHRERAYELVALWLEETGRNGNEESALELLCGGRGCPGGPFISQG